MSTISNERLEKLSEYDCADRYEVMSMATELLALRKEREKSEPVAWLVYGSKTFKDRTASTREVAEQAVKDRNDGSCIKPLYTAPPAPPVADDSLPYDPQIAEYEQMMEAEQAKADTTAQQFESLAGKAVVPEGWRLVPIEPTPMMLIALWASREGMAGKSENKIARVGYRLMLAAAPEPCK
ncbi:hypothetical protein SMY54_000693 [Cronobacter sakazakii]|nr:hypothetical protein [Cronobacter sakazakii]